jgi:DNA repair exonuclease SbcCD ATPase subunit
MLNVSKDIIHINWLIADETDSVIDNNTKLISITQCSGFQHFTISTALRMCLFLNKNNLYCNQLFIDEGFVSFDKFNLSIVPSFLKNLLSYFNSIIVVSHIDLIQDNIDDYVTINYNKNTSVSSIEYDSYKKVTKTRTKKLV